MRQIAAFLVLLAFAAPAAAQQEPSNGVSFSIEATRDRWHYRFENPSSFGTAELVPHEFTQTYWGDNRWAVFRGQFTLGKTQPHLFETEIAVTAPKTTRGDDYDTFFQPSGDVVVAGTTGNVSMQSWRVRQLIGVGQSGGPLKIAWSVGYQYRRDRSLFGPGDKTVTHTQPASLERSVITTRETTVSQVYGVVIRASRRWAGRAWSAEVGIDASPLSRARLLTQLPDKYPGMDIVFATLANELRPSMRLCLGRHYPVSVATMYTRSARYKKSGEFVRNAVSVDVGIGWNVR
jgi:hypothetical protein